MSLDLTDAPEHEFTGYRIELENRAELEASSTPMQFTLADFQAPEEIDPRGKVRHDLQKNMGACQGFSVANCGEYLWAMQLGWDTYKNDHQVSSLFMYLESQRMDGLLGRDSGSTISGGLKVAREIGFAPESVLPYRTPYPANAKTLVTDSMRKAASPLRVRSHTWLKSYNDIFQYFAARVGAVHTGTIWNNSFYATNGVLESVSLGGGGGHATAWLGYSKRKDSRGRNYIWRLNSHNDSWTELSPSVVDRICQHSYTAIVGISDMTTPGPRNVDWTKESVFV